MSFFYMRYNVLKLEDSIYSAKSQNDKNTNDSVTPGKQQSQPICSRFPRDHPQNERFKKNASTI